MVSPGGQPVKSGHAIGVPSGSSSAREIKPRAVNHSTAVAFSPSQSSSAQNSPSASSSASYAQIRHHYSNSVANSVTRHSAGGSAAAHSHQSPMRSLSSASGGLYVSAPGKIILFGEHAVVYGRTAIAGSIDLRTYLSLFTSADGRIYLSLPDMGIEKTWMLKDLQREIAKIPADLSLLAEEPPSLELVVPIARKLSGACEDQCGVQNLAILAFWYLLIGVLLRKRALSMETEEQQQPQEVPPTSVPAQQPGQSSGPPSPSKSWTGIGPCALQDAKSKSVSVWDLLAVKVTVRFKLPSCVGLGSSGAYCVCIASALLQTAGLIPPPCVSVDSDEFTWDESHLDLIRKYASAAESLIHGRASGLDAAICTYGGIATYTPGKRIENLQNAPDLLKVILINSRVERNTSRLVQTVKENYRKYPAVVEPIFDTIDALAYEAAKILQRQPVLLAEGGGENGSVVLENGGRSGGTLTPHITGGMLDGTEHNSLAGAHQNLQPMSLGGRSSSLGGGSSSYAAGGKRGSNASAVSGLSAGIKIERNELTETFDKLNELCRMNNQLLITLGVGHAKVDQICVLLGRYGIHPKMTGAGGGGCLYAFLKPDTSQTILGMIRDELRKDGYEMWQPTLGGPGVLLHQHKPEIFLSGSNSSSASSTGRGSGSSLVALPTSGGSGISPSTRSNTPASSHQTTPAVRHKK